MIGYPSQRETLPPELNACPLAISGFNSLLWVSLLSFLTSCFYLCIWCSWWLLYHAIRCWLPYPLSEFIFTASLFRWFSSCRLASRFWPTELQLDSQFAAHTQRCLLTFVWSAPIMIAELRWSAWIPLVHAREWICGALIGITPFAVGVDDHWRMPSGGWVL